jgi:hypothetical protein
MASSVRTPAVCMVVIWASAVLDDGETGHELLPVPAPVMAGGRRDRGGEGGVLPAATSSDFVAHSGVCRVG